ncbi:MAG: urease accessory protein UreD [Desulfocurvibacter africanus]
MSNNGLETGHGPSRCWRAALDLVFAPDRGRTILADVDFSGPLRVQRPFYPESGPEGGPEGSPCHCYILHPPGGLVSGDRLCISAEVRHGAHALLTTPSAGKIYGADSHNTAQGQEVSLQVNGTCEWLPQETIVFNGANALLSTEVELSAQARFIGWEILCLGRPAGDQPFLRGRLEQRFVLLREGSPLLRERLLADGCLEMLRAPCGLGGQTVTGTFQAVGPGDSAARCLEPLRAALDLPLRGVVAATFRLGLLLLRYLGPDAEEARMVFERARSVVRPLLLGRPACAPRIWNT